MTAAFHVVEWLSCAQISAVDRFNDLDPVRKPAMVHQQRSKGKFDSRPEASSLEIIERQQARPAPGSSGIVKAKLRVEVILEDAVDGLVKVLRGGGHRQADEMREPLA